MVQKITNQQIEELEKKTSSTELEPNEYLDEPIIEVTFPDFLTPEAKEILIRRRLDKPAELPGDLSTPPSPEKPD